MCIKPYDEEKLLPRLLLRRRNRQTNITTIICTRLGNIGSKQISIILLLLLLLLLCGAVCVDRQTSVFRARESFDRV